MGEKNIRPTRPPDLNKNMKDKIKIVSPRSEVEIHLPDGRVLSGPRGAMVGEFLLAIEHESQPVAAIINNDLRELTFPIEIESNVQPVLMDSPDGARIYRRSLTFLVEMAFADLFPVATLFVDHSVASGGHYCQVKGRETLSEAEVAALKAHMQELIEADLPFVKRDVPLNEVVEYFRVRGLPAWLHGPLHRLFALVRSDGDAGWFYFAIPAPP